MSSKKKSDAEKEKERLEALQKTEKHFLKGTFGDFFGSKGAGGKGQASKGAELSFGSGQDDRSSGKSGKSAEGNAPKSGELSFGSGQDGWSGGKSGKSAGGKAPKSGELSFGDRIDELEAKGRDITSALSSRTDALQRANEALKEVQALLDNPLYDGMPSLTGNGSGGVTANGSAGGRNSGAGSAGSLTDIDPGLMAGSDGDLFSGLAGAGVGAGGSGGAGAGSLNDPAGGVNSGTGSAESASAGETREMAAQQAQSQEKEKEPEKDPMEELDKLIGLTKIKHDVKELMDFVKIQKMRKEGGLKSVPVSLHLVFTGNPGTGKTTVARILAQLYKNIGVLSKGQLVEVDRSGLVAGYVGQTALKTAKKIEEAKGGVLFIDEAYALARKDDTFGQEAIDTILKAMEDNRDDFVVIVAGYTKPMENFINSNPGLKSRFNKYIEFPDYTIDELMGIFDMNCKKYDYEADDDVKAQIRAMIVQRKLATRENFANAREVRNLFEEIITNQARRVAAMENPEKEDMKKLLIEDLTETAEADAAKTLKKAEETESDKSGAEKTLKKAEETEPDKSDAAKTLKKAEETESDKPGVEKTLKKAEETEPDKSGAEKTLKKAEETEPDKSDAEKTLKKAEETEPDKSDAEKTLKKAEETEPDKSDAAKTLKKAEETEPDQSEKDEDPESTKERAAVPEEKS